MLITEQTHFFHLLTPCDSHQWNSAAFNTVRGGIVFFKGLAEYIDLISTSDQLTVVNSVSINVCIMDFVFLSP